MNYTYDCLMTRKALDHLTSCLNDYDYGTQEYNLAQRAFAYIANRLRQKEKVDRENISDR